MNQITEPPNKYNAGLDFNYAVWTADTRITLTNVPWNNDYRDVVSFDSTDELNAYINESESANVEIKGSMYARVSEPIALDMPFNAVNRFNYVRVHNPAQPVSGDTPGYFYYFILDVIHQAPNTTLIKVQLDVWQTYSRYVKWGNCYVERGHVGIANEDQFKNYGRDYLTIPEGLDMGSEYKNVERIKHQIMGRKDKEFNILVVSAVDLQLSGGSVNAPTLRSGSGQKFQGLPSGANVYIWESVKEFTAFMKDKQDEPWVTQGIMSITVIPPWQTLVPGRKDLLGSKSKIGAYAHPYQNGANDRILELTAGTTSAAWRNRKNIVNYIPGRYRHLKKFFTSPYMWVEVSTWNGQPLMLKPEMWDSGAMWFWFNYSLIAPGERMVFIPVGYGGSGLEEYLNTSVQVNNFPKLTIVNDGFISFMASNQASLGAARQSAGWSQERALRGNQVEYDQASAGINMANDLTNSATSQNKAQSAIDRENMVNQALTQSFTSPNLIGSISNNISTIHEIGRLNASTALANSGMRDTTQIQNSNTAYIRDSNKAVADWAARGDYETAIAGINAQVQDAKLTQPSVSGQSGGETYNLITDNVDLVATVKMVDQAAISVIGEYWLRYGYAVRRFMKLPPGLKAMSKFTYWKLTETYIEKAPITEAMKQALRGIVEKGVTVWSRPDYIGVIDIADNEALPGIKIDGYTPPDYEPEEPPEPEPEPTKRKNKKMIVFATNDSNPGIIYALAGTSPGTEANWIETRSLTLATQFMEACQVEEPVNLDVGDFLTYKDMYLQPVQTAEVGGETPPEA